MRDQTARTVGTELSTCGRGGLVCRTGGWVPICGGEEVDGTGLGFVMVVLRTCRAAVLRCSTVSRWWGRKVRRRVGCHWRRKWSGRCHGPV